MPKVAFIGAGSTVFAKSLLGDVLSFDELKDSEISLMDIDESRLKTSHKMVEKLAAATNSSPKISATTDRREAVEKADYVICALQVGGYKPSTVIDFEIPKKYGLRQTIADTLGIGGIMRGLRTIPVLIDLARDMEAGCPDALLIQYSNPMAMNCWAVSRASEIRNVGLCHSVQGTAAELARDLNLPPGEITYLCAGINHLAFYLRFEHKGQDLYPMLRDLAARGDIPPSNRVRYEMLLRLGYFVTESSEHFSEYCNHFIRRDKPELIENYEIPLDEYIRRCEEQIKGWEKMRESFENDEPISHKRTHEYGAQIIHSMETGLPRVIYGNVGNSGLITNLPNDCCVELPCLVDENGIQPTKIGGLPPQLAAVMMTNINVQSLTVEAALTRKRDYVYHAAMLDPHTSAELSLQEVWSLVDELLDAHGDMIPNLTSDRVGNSWVVNA
ncbi:MAG: alpha-glucosidase/alpha-galactosidase [Fimbriimonadales bacterium]